MADVDVAVLAPSVYVSITIEAGEGDEIHLHAGGQGVWVARMLRKLDHAPVVCAPIGGEAGLALIGLVAEWGIGLHTVDTIGETPAYVHDRREGERVELARSRRPTLRRHELDELYHGFLKLALDAGCCVVTGPEQAGPQVIDLYRRLGADLDAAGIDVVGDLHGVALDAFLTGGPLRALKVGLRDLLEDGILDEDDTDEEDAVSRVCDDYRERGVETVLVSRGDAPVLAATAEGRYRVTGPDLQPVGTEGSGDTMTAALASSLVRRLDTQTMLARAWAAGAANVTRRGLGSGDPGLVDRLTERAVVERRGGA